jgi:hypothetical protein
MTLHCSTKSRCQIFDGVIAESLSASHLKTAALSRPNERKIMKALFAAALLAGSVATFGYANAMPLAPHASGVNADIIQVAGGCGRGFHRGPRGGCRENMRGPVVVVRPHERRCRFWDPGRRICRTWW